MPLLQLWGPWALWGRRCSAGARTRFYVQLWGGGGGQEGPAQGERGGFPQRRLSVLKYSAYKRGQEFPAQTAREGGNSLSQLPDLAPAAGDFCAVVFQSQN